MMNLVTLIKRIEKLTSKNLNKLVLAIIILSFLVYLGLFPIGFASHIISFIIKSLFSPVGMLFEAIFGMGMLAFVIKIYIKNKKWLRPRKRRLIKFRR